MNGYLNFVAIVLNLSETCLSFQIKQTNIYRAQDYMIFFSRILQYPNSEVEHNDFECFPILTEYIKYSIYNIV